MKCGNGHDISITNDADGTVLTKPSDLFSILHCIQCNNDFTSQEINIKYYLYFSKYCCNNSSSHEIPLYCLNCYMKNSYSQVGLICTNGNHTTITQDNNHFAMTINNACMKCKQTAEYNKTYIENQLEKLTITDLDKMTYSINQKKIALLQYP